MQRREYSPGTKHPDMLTCLKCMHSNNPSLFKCRTVFTCTMKFVLRDHCHILMNHILVAEYPTYQYSCTYYQGSPVMTDHIFMDNGASF